MPVAFGAGLTVVSQSWAGFTAVRTSKNLALQYLEENGTYTIYGYDGPEVHVCTLWTGTVPDGVIAGGFSQAQNDAAKDDFEDNYKASGNKSILLRAADGKQFMLPNIFPGEVILNFTGCSDKLSPAERFGGDLFGAQKAGTGTASQTLDFLDGVFLAGGHISWEGGSWGSSVYFEVLAPATTTKAPTVTGQGNCNKVATGLGFNIIVPAAGDGEFDLDVPVPVPANDDETNSQTGYWNYSEPWIGKGSVSPVATPIGKFNLFDAELELAHFCKLQVAQDSGARDLMAPSIKPKWILPEWKMKVIISNADAAKTLKVTWDLLLARRKSV